MNQLEDFIMPTQKELFSSLCKMFGSKVVCQKGDFILIPGEAPIMLVAHLDTVHKERVQHICETRNGNILMSPQGIGGDDRCGVYALVMTYKLARVKPWLLFTCDEEIGGVGASAFCDQFRKGKLPSGLKTLKCLVEIDRKGKNDAVYYACANDEFEAYITSKGFKTDFGSFSDISEIAPQLGVAAVNLSSGYYNAHTQHEYINRKQLNTTVKKVVEIVEDSAKSDFPTYEYFEKVSGFKKRHYGGYFDHTDCDYPKKGIYSSGGKILTRNGEDFEEPDLGGIPVDIKDAYIELLDFYSICELEALRAEFGDSWILRLYESEFGVSYESPDDDGESIDVDDEKWAYQNK